MSKALPVLALVNVFKHLNQNDLLSCKRVCKGWKQAIDSLTFDTLMIHDFGPFGAENQKWPFPRNGTVGYRNSLQVPANKKVKPEFLERHFIRCKHLYIESKLDNRSSLNALQELETLVVDFPIDDFTLKLEQLKFLSLNWSAKNLTLDLPQLDTLLCWKYIETINLSRPLRLVYLQCDELPLNIKQFRGLEYLVSKHSDWIDPDFLAHLPRLRELRIYPKSLIDLNYLMMRVHSEKTQLERDQLRIYMTGVEEISVLIDFGLRTQNYLHLNEKNLASVVRNYEQLADHIPFRFIVNYTSLIRHFLTLPSDFHHKFLNIIQVIVDGPLAGESDVALLVRFHNDCQTVHTLKIQEAHLDRTFYERIAACPGISNLFIAETDFEFDNFDFLLAMPNLRNLMLRSLRLRAGLIESLLRCLNFRKLLFKFPEQSDDAKARSGSWKLLIKTKSGWTAAFKVTIDAKDSFCRNIDRVKALLRKKCTFFVE